MMSESVACWWLAHSAYVGTAWLARLAFVACVNSAVLRLRDSSYLSQFELGGPG